MPLTSVKKGCRATIKKVGGGAGVKQHLENLGFVPGTPVVIINEIGGNMIVNIKESRVAVGRETAAKITV